MNKTEVSNKKQGLSHPNDGLPSYAGILGEICQESGVELTWVANNWVAILEKNEQIRFALGFKFGINSAAASMVADDKCATYGVLQKQGIPAVQHQLLYKKDNPASYARNYQSEEYIEMFFRQNREHVVIKPNNGQGGEGVYQASSMDDVRRALEKIFRSNELAAMCPFYNILHEYRFIMLDGKVRLAYKKVRGEDWRFNLNSGARAERIEDSKLYEKLKNLAAKTTKAMNLRFCSVDMAELNEQKLIIMEVNSGVVTGKYLAQHPEEYEKVKKIYADVLEKMFAEN